MKEIEIKMQAPFAFCEECNLKQLIGEVRYAGGEADQQILKCRFRNQCANAVRLYQQRLEDGRTF